MSAVYSVKVDDNIDAQLSYLVNKMGHEKSYFIKKAIQTYLEDKKDYFLAEEALLAIANGEKVFTWEEVKKELGV